MSPDRVALRDDWPFLPAMPPERIALLHQLVDGDPFLGGLGVTLRAADADTATLAAAYRPNLAQPTGILHGGLHSILVDTAIAQALLATIRPGFTVVTVRLDTNYFAPVRSGCIVATATVVRKGKRVAHGQAVVTDERDVVVAQGWGVFAVVGSS